MSKYEKGKVVTGCVTGTEKYGIFVKLDDNYSGLIHISEISNSFVRDISNYVNIGEKIKVKILETDNNRQHAKLTIKDLDYRLNDKKRNRKIEETSNGFKTLGRLLNKWIDEKESELLQKNKKN